MVVELVRMGGVGLEEAGLPRGVVVRAGVGVFGDRGRGHVDREGGAAMKNSCIYIENGY